LANFNEFLGKQDRMDSNVSVLFTQRFSRSRSLALLKKSRKTGEERWY